MRPVVPHIMSRHLAAVLLVIAVYSCWMSGRSNGQQDYENAKGYYCSDSGRKSCSTFAIYRAQSDYSTVPQIAKLFNTNATTVARLNKLSSSKQKLAIGKAVIIPLTCRCGANSTSFANISYTIVQGDTFSGLNTDAFESLSTVTEVLAANSQLDPTSLQIGDKIVFPVRCACPSKAQISQGVKSLVTYPVANLDYVKIIAASFGVSAADIITANTLTGADTQINYQTTLVIPINTSQPNYSYVAPAPGSAPTPESQSTPSQAPAPSAPGTRSSSSHTGVYIAIAVGVCAALLILAALGLCLLFALRRKKRAKRKDGFQSPLVQRSHGGGLGSSSGAGGVSSFSDLPSRGKSLGSDHLAGIADVLGSDKPTLYTYEELCDATNNFSDSSRLQGSTVYRGLLHGQVVAIKQTKEQNPSQELRILSRIHHTNVVKLVGLCSSAAAEHLYLVYEYAENGSLNDCLQSEYFPSSRSGEPQLGSSQSSLFLSWTMRVQVALDAASGLEYIHDYVNPSYVHKDVKSSNILLDATFRAKLANFGMARSGGSAANNDLMTRHIVGTYGYMAPEYLAHGLVTTKADVFSFGVVLLELLSGSEAILEEGDGEDRYLYTSVAPILDSADPAASLRNWMDPALQNGYPMDTALSLASMARNCLDMDPAQRPNMKDITFSLSKLLTASLEWESSSVFANTLAGTPIEGR